MSGRIGFSVPAEQALPVCGKLTLSDSGGVGRYSVDTSRQTVQQRFQVAAEQHFTRLQGTFTALGIEYQTVLTMDSKLI